MHDYYSILEVNPAASMETITKNYRTLMKKNHPDLNKAWNAREKTILINQAYEVLSDPVKREAFDRQLFNQYAQEETKIKQHKILHHNFLSWSLIFLYIFADMWYQIRTTDPAPVTPAIFILFLFYTAARDKKRRMISRMGWVMGIYLLWIGLQGAAAMVVWKTSLKGPQAHFLISLSQGLPIWLVMRRSDHFRPNRSLMRK